MRCSVALFAWIAALPILHGAEWNKLSSPNFEFYTTFGERDARQTLETFEQARDFFLRVKSTTVTSHLPVTLVGFASVREYRPYSAKEFTPAYYVGDEQRDYVVMCDLGAERRRVAVHEYVHLLVRHSGLTLPLWLNEGLADTYSTMEVREGQILLGEIPTDRARTLTSDRWMRLPDLFAAGANSPEYNERDRAGIFYAQSWLLVHMLALGRGYADKFPAFIERVSASGSSQTALAEIYGKSLADIERGMNAYFRQATVGGAAYKAGLQRVEIGPARPATELEIGLTLAKLMALLGRLDEAAGRLDQLSAAHPGNPEIEQALAYLAWQKGDEDAALRGIRQAMAHGAGDWKTYWDYARLLSNVGRDREARMEAARKALEGKPDLAEARLMLARDLYALGRYADVLSELRQIRNIDPEHAASMFLTMAHAAAELKQIKEAGEYAEQAKQHARRPEDSARAERLLEALRQNADQGIRPASPDKDDPQRPILRRRPAKKPARAPR